MSNKQNNVCALLKGAGRKQNKGKKWKRMQKVSVEMLAWQLIADVTLHFTSCYDL